MAEGRATVAVIGAGFSGLLTALRLLGCSEGPRVRLIERRGPFARGAAYSTLDPDHLLNVRASNMSAFPERPDHFVRWLEANRVPIAGGQFAPRRVYGNYLQSLIQNALEGSPAGRFMLEADTAAAVARDGDGWRVELGVGRSFAADAVVIAVGNLPPKPPAAFSAEAARHPAYVQDPWSLQSVDIPNAGAALIIGTGLTMIDVALQLARRAPGLSLLALSRRGLLPRRHLLEGPPAQPRAPPPRQTPRHLLRALRAETSGGEWRGVLDGLRPHVHELWRGWTTSERRQFLRHLRPWWDVHRHRLAPPAASKLDHLMASGALTVEAGRILGAEPVSGGLTVSWRRRGDAAARSLVAQLIVNCAGPDVDTARSGDPLLMSLTDAGLVRGDACGLGLDVDPKWRVVAADGRANETLFAVGPITRGSVWEITSVPDIRVQAEECARAVAEALGVRRRAAPETQAAASA